MTTLHVEQVNYPSREICARVDSTSSGSAQNATIQKCKKFKKLLDGLVKGVNVQCCLCGKSTATDHRTNHIKHFLFNHLSKEDKKETVFKILNISRCKTYDECWKKGLLSCLKKAEGKPNVKGVPSSHLPPKKRLTRPFKVPCGFPYIEDRDDLIGRPRSPQLNKRKSNKPSTTKLTCSVPPHLNSCDSANTSIVSGINRSSCDFPRIEGRRCESFSINQQQAFTNGNYPLSNRESSRSSSASTHPMHPAQTPSDSGITSTQTSDYDEETIEGGLLLLQFSYGGQQRDVSTTPATSLSQKRQRSDLMVSVKMETDALSSSVSPVIQINRNPSQLVINEIEPSVPSVKVEAELSNNIPHTGECDRGTAITATVSSHTEDGPGAREDSESAFHLPSELKATLTSSSSSVEEIIQHHQQVRKESRVTTQPQNTSETAVNAEKLDIYERSRHLRLTISKINVGNQSPCPFCHERPLTENKGKNLRKAHIIHFFQNHLNRGDEKKTVFELLGVPDSKQYNDSWNIGINRLRIRQQSEDDVSIEFLSERHPDPPDNDPGVLHSSQNLPSSTR